MLDTTSYSETVQAGYRPPHLVQSNCVDLGHIGYDEQPALHATRAAILAAFQCWLDLPGASNCKEAS